MRLEHATVTDFRSIQHASVDFSVHRCRVLVGINESGKSNLLRALSFLDPTVTPQPEDIRTPMPGEQRIERAKVGFRVRLAAAGVALAPNGDFRIDDTLDPAPETCESPLLLIRSTGGA